MRQDPLFMMNVQTQCCQFILIKKKSSCFLQRVVCVLLPRGRSYLQLEKTTIGKVKTKKGRSYLQLEKLQLEK